MSEIEAFPRATLTYHYPEVPLHGDFTTIQSGGFEAIDVLAGGTPCQSFSVAGLRGGMADERGNLALEYLRLAERLRPRWLVWENVPGVLSSAGGRDFGSFLGGLVECGYGFAYRVLDAQYFGLAQRRKRVFVVGCLGDWRRAAAVLFEPASLRGHPAPGREARERVAASLTRGADSGGKGGYAGRRREDDVNLVANPLGAKRDGGWRGDLDNDTYAIQERAVSENPDAGPQGAGFQADMAYMLEARHHVQAVAMALNAHGGSGRMDGESETFVTHTLNAHRAGSVQEDGTGHGVPITVTHSLRADGFDASEDGTGRGTPLVADLACAVTNQSHMDGQAGREAMFVGTTSAVRRLTPRECERLQGFPDDYTLIPWRNGMASDGPRYRALGNSMAVPVMRWIGRRIQAVDQSAL